VHLVSADILGLGHSIKAFGFTLALILTWFVIIGGVAGGFIFYIVSGVLAERRENSARQAAYDDAHPTL
jgi:hypothetical protein